MILLDTNILLRYVAPADAAHGVAKSALAVLRAAGEHFALVPQNIYEFWATATRPLASNGLGLSITECQTQVSSLKAFFTFLPDQPTLFAEWESLVVTYACHGRVSFDARLVAAMQTHGINRILTLNGSDFSRYPGVTVIDPHTVAAMPPPTP
ncbi:type II toxin-antitoxin system VapC family toxin [Limnoglobus roseus]|uniref:PIN domain-containing protein n=1 Tax=Limnoglobus roseus TaxID=2598579 RepID=A0A5C1AA83_9BACT|nr:type II toxin-antitoxin system VapC family toxin [Limnoglobus roseus]QEL13958.1 PIN domain-containing protein [Limnoglobus roseus]